MPIGPYGPILVLGKEGVIPQLRELWGPAGFAYLNEINLGEAYGGSASSRCGI